MTQSARRRRVAAYGVCQDAAGRVFLVAVDGETWGLPGGTVAHGESPQQAIVRLAAAATGRTATVRGVRAALADQVGGVHHDRVVFDLSLAGVPMAGAQMAGAPMVGAAMVGGSRWAAPADLATMRLTPYTALVLGLDGAGPAVADPDEGWLIEHGLAMDRTGERPRVQRFSAYAVATDPKARILLARIAPNYPGAGRWHLPGGGTDFGEAPDVALLRELTEETGQRGSVTGLLDVSHRHNPTAMGWEGYPIDWHTIRVVYRVEVTNPTVPMVTEAAGGSTADAAWFQPADLPRLSLTELAAAALDRSGVAGGGGNRVA